MVHSTLRLATIVSAPFAENSFVAHLPGENQCLVIDPGFEPSKIIEYLAAQSLEPAAILITHGHSDHIAGNAVLKERWPGCPLVIGRRDAPKLIYPELNLSAAFGFNLVSPPADVTVVEGDICRAAGFELEVREIPGHSCGHVVYVWKGGQPLVVFGGDVLFNGGVGRTDFPDGSFEELAAGIRDKLFTLPDDTQVYPGHGPATTVGREKRFNPFVNGVA